MTPQQSSSGGQTPVPSRPGSFVDRASYGEHGSATSSPTLSVPNSAVDKTPDDASRLKTFLSILKQFIGVTDMAAVRFSLPAQLMEPIPNLEYWHYLDRPEAFASIGDSEEPLGRMLGALRFWFTKDLKYVKGKPCKPYNSALGEFFRCNWEVSETSPPLLGVATAPTKLSKPLRISYLTEQTSHHPPVSAYFISCPEKGITARGFDQISASFTGTRIRVSPGIHNLGIFVTLHNRNETYNMTHPIAHLGGLLRGNLSISVADTCYVTCPKTRMKAILTYLEEGWLGRTQNKVQGVIFKYDPDNDNKTKIKDVSDSDIIARVEGCWHEQIYWTRGGKAFEKSEKNLVVDLAPLWPLPKVIPPEDKQLPNESRRFWGSVTEAILAKQFSAATNAKQDIEERQRQKAAERKAQGVEWKPRFFTDDVTPAGNPELTAEGMAAIQKLERADWQLNASSETGA